MKVKLPKLFKSDTFLPMSAVVVFAALIAILTIVKRSGRNTYIGYRSRASARRRAYRGRRRVPSRALIGKGQWNRRWDQMSGSSTYSTDMMKGRGRGRGRSMGRPMLHMA